MIDRARIVQSLRADFKAGATPWHLIKRIVAELGDSASSSKVQDILAEAFHLPVVRLGPSLDSAQRLYGRGALNRSLLAEIAANKEQWDPPAPAPSAPATTWLDGLRVIEPEAAKKDATAAPFPGLSRERWVSLTGAEQESLRVQLASSVVISNRLELLARLAERLQERVEELEADLKLTRA